MSARTAKIDRQTSETKIELSLNLDGQGDHQVATGVGFLDHMLELFARHAGIDLKVAASGDLHIDAHHTVEDIGICLGTALRQALGEKRGIRRYGHMLLPMDESLVGVALDLGGRSFLVFQATFPTPKVGDFDTELVAEFFQAVTANAQCNLHVMLHHGSNSHHISEAIFKGFARALRMAISVDPGETGVPSTKGVI